MVCEIVNYVSVYTTSTAIYRLVQKTQVYDASLPFSFFFLLPLFPPFFFSFYTHTHTHTHTHCLPPPSPRYIGLDEIANEIEDPFGTDDNDLDIFAISEYVELSTRLMLEVRPMP